MEAETIGTKLIGLTFDQAMRCCEKYGGVFLRPVKVNGKFFAGTRDRRSDRINLHIENDIIPEFYIG